MTDWRTIEVLRIPNHETVSASGFVVSSVRLETNGHHDRVTIWNRGGNAGTLTVRAGDGQVIARAAMPDYVVEEVGNVCRA